MTPKHIQMKPRPEEISLAEHKIGKALRNKIVLELNRKEAEKLYDMLSQLGFLSSHFSNGEMTTAERLASRLLKSLK